MKESVKDIIYKATYLRRGIKDTTCFYNQSFASIGEQLDILTNVYGLKIIELKRIEKLSELLN